VRKGREGGNGQTRVSPRTGRTARKGRFEEGSELLSEGEDAVDVETEDAADGERREYQDEEENEGGRERDGGRGNEPVPCGVGVLVVTARKKGRKVRKAGGE